MRLFLHLKLRPFPIATCFFPRVSDSLRASTAAAKGCIIRENAMRGHLTRGLHARASLLTQSGIAAMLLTIGASALSASPALAQNVSFAGKTINVTIGYDAGGSYDYYGRLLARHMGKQLPGEPRMVPLNMPGAAGFRALGFLYAAAPKDGTTIGITTQQIAIADKLGGGAVKYEAGKFNYIGRITSSVEIVLMAGKSKVKTIEDARSHSVPVSATSPGSSAYDYWKVLNNIGGTKFNVIGGYNSAARMLLAMENGETEGAFTSWNTVKVRRPDLLRDNKSIILMQFTTARHPDLKDVPALIEAGKTEEDRQILALYASGGDMGRAFFAPPGVDAAIVATLRRAFDAMIADKEFLAEVEKVKAEFDPMSGEKLQAFVAQFENLSPALLERARKARE